jgi:hypothetical protein
MGPELVCARVDTAVGNEGRRGTMKSPAHVRQRKRYKGLTAQDSAVGVLSIQPKAWQRQCQAVHRARHEVGKTSAS